MNKTETTSLLEAQRGKLLIAISLIAIIAMYFVNPIAQDLSYHQFADQNSLFSIPHFWNVVSNIPFLLVGVIGLLSLRNSVKLPGALTELKTAYITFFIGVFLTGLGSAYYHWMPDNATLLWDRLPMTISFVAFFVVIVGENISVSLARKMLFPLLFIGVFSVLYWMFTESKGSGDLRLYALVQFLPILLIPFILWLYSSPFKGQKYIVAVISAYVLAKMAEYFDHQILDMLGFMSGHPIKHVIAAIGTYFFYLALKKRIFLGKS